MAGSNHFVRLHPQTLLFLFFVCFYYLLRIFFIGGGWSWRCNHCLLVALPQPAQEVANHKTRLLLEVSCHFGNLQVQYSRISQNLTFTFTEAKRKRQHEKRTKGLKKRPLTGFTPHIYESVKRTAVRSINYQQATTFYILHISPHNLSYECTNI